MNFFLRNKLDVVKEVRFQPVCVRDHSIGLSASKQKSGKWKKNNLHMRNKLRPGKECGDWELSTIRATLSWIELSVKKYSMGSRWQERKYPAPPVTG